MLIRDQLARAARFYPDNPAVLCDGEQRTYRALDERSTRLANALRGLGLVEGDRVALLLDNSIACIEFDCACAKAGLVRVALNPRITQRDAEYIVRDAQPRVLAFGSNFTALAAALVTLPGIERSVVVAAPGGRAGELQADDYEALIAAGGSSALDVALTQESLYSLFYTSGTSGRPKGVMLSNRSLVQVAYNILLELPPAPGERILLLQPLSHGAAFYVLPYLMRGCTVVLTRRFEPEETLRLMHDGGIGAVKLVPTMLHKMLSVLDTSPRQFPRLSRLIYGGAGIPGEVLRQAITIFGSRLVQHYGQSEAPSTLTILPQEEHTAANLGTGVLSSAGRAWSTVQLRVVDENGQPRPTNEIGEVVVRAPHVMSGYWRNPALSEKAVRDGWLYTSDLGRLDERGFLYLAGRKDEMIISGGFNIAPRDVEDVLYEHPAVREVAVVGQPDDQWGHAVVAYAALKAHANAAEILEFSRPILGFKNPKRLYILDELPKNSNGKIERKSLSPPQSL